MVTETIVTDAMVTAEIVTYEIMSAAMVTFWLDLEELKDLLLDHRSVFYMVLCQM